MLYTAKQVIIDTVEGRIIFIFTDGSHRDVAVSRVQPRYVGLCEQMYYILKEYNVGNLLVVPPSHVVLQSFYGDGQVRKIAKESHRGRRPLSHFGLNNKHHAIATV